jgi:hypothetical protein
VGRALFARRVLREAAVTGISADRWRQSTPAMIVLNEGRSATAHELAALGGSRSKDLSGTAAALEDRADYYPLAVDDDLRQCLET